LQVKYIRLVRHELQDIKSLIRGNEAYFLVSARLLDKIKKCVYTDIYHTDGNAICSLNLLYEISGNNHLFTDKSGQIYLLKDENGNFRP